MNPESEIFGHERQTSFAKDLRCLDFDKAYKDVFVIKVDLKSKEVSKLTLFDKMNFINPLSLKFEHLDKLSDLKEFINCEFEIA